MATKSIMVLLEAEAVAPAEDLTQGVGEEVLDLGLKLEEVQNLLWKEELMVKKGSCRYYLSRSNHHRVDMPLRLNFELWLVDLTQEFGSCFHSNIVPKNMSRNLLEDCLRYLATSHSRRLHCSNSHRFLHPTNRPLPDSLG